MQYFIMPINQIFKIGLEMSHFTFKNKINKYHSNQYEIDLSLLLNPYRKFMLMTLALNIYNQLEISYFVFTRTRLFGLFHISSAQIVPEKHGSTHAYARLISIFITYLFNPEIAQRAIRHHQAISRRRRYERWSFSDQPQYLSYQDIQVRRIQLFYFRLNFNTLNVIINKVYFE